MGFPSRSYLETAPTAYRFYKAQWNSRRLKFVCSLHAAKMLLTVLSALQYLYSAFPCHSVRNALCYANIHHKALNKYHSFTSISALTVSSVGLIPNSLANFSCSYAGWFLLSTVHRPDMCTILSITTFVQRSVN